MLKPLSGGIGIRQRSPLFHHRCHRWLVVTMDDAKAAAKVLLDKGAKNVIATLGERGAVRSACLVNRGADTQQHRLRARLLSCGGIGRCCQMRSMRAQ